MSAKNTMLIKYRAAVVTGLVLCSLICCAQNEEKEAIEMSAKSAFEELLLASGDTFIEKEKVFMNDKQNAIGTLNKNLNVDDSFTNIYSAMLLKWVEGRSPNNDLALKYLDALPKRMSLTPLPSPVPTAAAGYLSHEYQASVSEILAVRLVKLPDMDDWRIFTTLLYLRNEKPFVTTGLLLRFITQTENEDHHEFALETIDIINDPKLETKILVEKSRLHALNKDLPYALRSRISKN